MASFGAIARGFGKAGRAVGSIGLGIEKFRKQELSRSALQSSLDATKERIESSRFDREEKKRKNKLEDDDLLFIHEYQNQATAELAAIKGSSNPAQALSEATSAMRTWLSTNSPASPTLQAKKGEFIKNFIDQGKTLVSVFEAGRQEKEDKATGKFEAARALHQRGRVITEPGYVDQETGADVAAVDRSETPEEAFNSLRQQREAELNPQLLKAGIDPEQFWDEQRALIYDRYKKDDKASVAAESAQYDLQRKKLAAQPKPYTIDDVMSDFTKVQNQINRLAQTEAMNKGLSPAQIFEAMNNPEKAPEVTRTIKEIYGRAFRQLKKDRVWGPTIKRGAFTANQFILQEIEDAQLDPQMSEQPPTEASFLATAEREFPGQPDQKLKMIKDSLKVPGLSDTHKAFWERMLRKYSLPEADEVKDTAIYRPGFGLDETSSGGVSYRDRRSQITEDPNYMAWKERENAPFVPKSDTPSMENQRAIAKAAMESYPERPLQEPQFAEDIPETPGLLTPPDTSVSQYDEYIDPATGEPSKSLGSMSGDDVISGLNNGTISALQLARWKLENGGVRPAEPGELGDVKNRDMSGRMIGDWVAGKGRTSDNPEVLKVMRAEMGDEIDMKRSLGWYKTLEAQANEAVNFGPS